MTKADGYEVMRTELFKRFGWEHHDALHWGDTCNGKPLFCPKQVEQDCELCYTYYLLVEYASHFKKDGQWVNRMFEAYKATR